MRFASLAARAVEAAASRLRQAFERGAAATARLTLTAIHPPLLLLGSRIGGGIMIRIVARIPPVIAFRWRRFEHETHRIP